MDRKEWATSAWMQSEFETWLWNKFGMFASHLRFLLTENVPNKSRLGTYQKLLVLYANKNLKQLTIEIEKIKRVYLSIISREEPRPYFREKVLLSWLSQRNLSEPQFEEYLELITTADIQKSALADTEAIRDQIYELVVWNEPLLLAAMSRHFPWIAEIDQRLVVLAKAFESKEIEELEEERVHVTRDELERKYAELNQRLVEKNYFESLIEFFPPARSVKNAWRKPF
jgi:hypothetical protein